MRSIDDSKKAYLDELARRQQDGHISKSYQLTGLEIANILEDWQHKSLYIKIAKEHGESKMLQLAKSVAEKRDVRNKGAYFMQILKQNLRKYENVPKYEK